MLNQSSNETIALVNVESALGRIRGNKTIFKALLVNFTNGDYLVRIISEIEDGHLEAAAGTVHALKGVSANLSLDALHEATKGLEKRLKNGDDPSEDLERLKEVSHKTTTQINQILVDL